MFEKLFIFFIFTVILLFTLLLYLSKGKGLNRMLKEPDKARIPETYETYVLSLDEKIKFILVFGSCLGAAAYVFYNQLLLSILFLGISVIGFKPYAHYLKEKRKRELNDQFRDLLYSLSSSISAGRQMPEAIKDASVNLKLIYSDHDFIILELSYMVKRIFESHESLDTILIDFALRSGIEDIRNFVDIYLTCRSTGGDLECVIRKTSDMLIEKIEIMKEIKIITSQKKFEAKILTSIPFIVIIFLQLVSPEYLNIMYSTVSGRTTMTLGLIGIIGAYFWSMKITDIEV